MTGPYTASTPGPCGRCEKRIRVGAKVWYVGPLADDANRRCEKCARAGE